jgi:hypothetical protein
MRTGSEYGTPYAAAMPEYQVGIHRVTCSVDSTGRRVWHCDCPDYDRRLRLYGEGFCPHLVVAFLESMEDEQAGSPE